MAETTDAHLNLTETQNIEATWIRATAACSSMVAFLIGETELQREIVSTQLPTLFDAFEQAIKTWEIDEKSGHLLCEGMLPLFKDLAAGAKHIKKRFVGLRGPKQADSNVQPNEPLDKLHAVGDSSGLFGNSNVEADKVAFKNYATQFLQQYYGELKWSMRGGAKIYDTITRKKRRETS